MVIVKIFKFDSNLEYLSSHLKDLDIPHFADFKNKSLLCEEKLKDDILKIITELEIDENEVYPDDELFEGCEEQNKNMYNSGHYTERKSPPFYSDKNSYLTYGFIVLVSSLTCMVEYINSKSFSKTGFWVIFFILFPINLSLFYQYFKHKRNSN
jgi:hypothetical protein